MVSVLEFSHAMAHAMSARASTLLPDPDALHGMKLAGSSATGGLLSRYLSDLSKQARTMTPEEAISVARSTVH